MKQKDVALLIVVVIIAGVFSFMISNFLLIPAAGRQAEVEVVSPISSEFVDPDEKYFNSQSVNPTQIIRIGEGENTDPFSNGQ